MSRLQTNTIRHLGSTVDNLTLDNAGRVLMPNQPAFHAYNNATQALGTSGAVKMLAQVADVNRSGIWNISTSRFTAPVAGAYLFSFTGTFFYNGGTPGTDDTAFMGLYKNGSAYNFSAAAGVNPRNRIVINPQYFARDGIEYSQTATWILELAVNDYIEFYVIDVNTAGVQAEACLINGHLIG
jgi:hypothetical protein